MPYLWLAYTDPDVDSGNLQKKRFKALTDYEVPVTEHKTTRVLTSKLRKLVTGRWSVWRIGIGVSALLAHSEKVWMRAFWQGFEQFVCFDESETPPDDGDFIEVDCGDGEAPIEFVNGIKEFESWSLICAEVDGSV